MPAETPTIGETKRKVMGTNGRPTESDTTRRLAALIRERRLALDISQRRIAAAIDRSVAYVSERDAGATPWNVDELVVIARLLHGESVLSLLVRAGVR